MAKQAKPAATKSRAAAGRTRKVKSAEIMKGLNQVAKAEGARITKFETGERTLRDTDMTTVRIQLRVPTESLGSIPGISGWVEIDTDFGDGNDAGAGPPYGPDGAAAD